ncbi:hypothetical protein EYF80_056855 [Liparis tanakae]|uniref:Uncharacterized protein n=1 Tax=Liparis tanakae TaxID=230148 RepID=A0A4Z2EXK6_9TELE|nr:hypothetical protein EYF80_056855 [Liparis tanakae]
MNAKLARRLADANVQKKNHIARLISKSASWAQQWCSAFSVPLRLSLIFASIVAVSFNVSSSFRLLLYYYFLLCLFIMVNLCPYIYVCVTSEACGRLREAISWVLRPAKLQKSHAPPISLHEPPGHQRPPIAPL